MSRSERSLYRTGWVDVSRSAWPLGAPPLDLPHLEGDHTADVAVVGAGLAGSSLALHLSEAGADVALLEAKVPGWGASGRNAGHVVPYRDLDRAFAALPDRGEGWLELFREGQDIVYRIAEKYDIDCDAVQGGYLQVAHRDSLVTAAEMKAEKWAKRGYDIRYADRVEVAKLTGSQHFHGGTLAEKGGRVNPYRFTRGMVSAAIRAGARVFEHSAADSIRGEGPRWRVQTAGGCVVADRVVVCTNGYTAGLLPELERAWCPLSVFAIALKPLPEGLRTSLIPSGASISQFPTGFHPTLIDEHGRIVSSLLTNVLRPQSSTASLRWLTRWLHRVFPSTRDVPLAVDAYWTGSTAWSTDELPRIFEVGPGLLALMCFSGEGNVPAPLLGRHLAQALTADDLRQLVLPVQPPSVPRLRGRYDLGLRRFAVPALRLAERMGLF
jgi:glycine/D-amino acid oxidase-like deaminating enzyme